MVNVGSDDGKFSMGLNSSELPCLLPSFSNREQQDGRLSETTLDLIESSSSAPGASRVSGGVRHGEAPFAHEAGEGSLPQNQSSLSSYGGTVPLSAGSTELNYFFPTIEPDHITPTLEQATNPVLKAVTDAALENDLLELLSSPMAVSTTANAVCPPPENQPPPNIQGQTVSTMAERSIPLPEFSLRPEVYPSLAVSGEKKSNATADSRESVMGNPVIEDLWTLRPEIRREPSSGSTARVDRMSMPPNAAGHLELHQTSQGSGNNPIPALLLQNQGGQTVSPLPELQQLTAFDKTLRERSLAIFSATEEQMKRPMKKSRTYSKAIPSRFCHICTRQSKKSSPHAFCHNINRGTCRKAVCEKCFIKFGWDWNAVSAPGSQWLCPHCCNICPKGAQCYNYEKSNDHRPKNQPNAAHGVKTQVSLELPRHFSTALVAQNFVQPKRAQSDNNLREKANDNHQTPELHAFRAEKTSLSLEIPLHLSATHLVPDIVMPASARAPADSGDFMRSPHDGNNSAMF